MEATCSVHIIFLSILLIWNHIWDAKNRCNMRSSLTRLRFGACNLQINLGRRHRPLPFPVEDRICDFRMSTTNTRFVEDEYHFIMQCPLYHNLRSVLPSEIIEFDSSFASLPDFEKCFFIMSPTNYYLILSYVIAKFAFCFTNKHLLLWLIMSRDSLHGF